jgi:hypothetical protein
MNKFEYVRDILSIDKHKGRKIKLLDVGCRGCELRNFLDNSIDYEGVDLFQNPSGSVKHVLDVSRGIPLKSGAYDYVVALDLVEHLDDFEGGLNELLRLSNHRLIVMLPNIAHIFFRVKFLFTGKLSGKYDMCYKMGQDRHRWVTTQAQVDDLLRDFAKEHNLKFEVMWFTDSPKKNFFARLCRIFGISPNLWAWASLYVLERK